jgi:hypothetical protein
MPVYGDPQAIVDRFARLAQPRLFELLKLTDVQHVYDPERGRAPAKSWHEGREIVLDKTVRTVQPYKNIERFLSEDRVMTYIIDPGLIPIAKSIVLNARGRKLLVTRKVASAGGVEPIVAHLDGVGVRILQQVDRLTEETLVIWECLYGVE